jgi:hypothetical protein
MNPKDADDPTIIDRDTYLKGLALFTLAHQHYCKAREFEQALFTLLQVDDLGCLADEIYDERAGSFDSGLKREGFSIPEV